MINSRNESCKYKRKDGRRPPILDNQQINRMVELYNEGKINVAEVAKF
ncbi:MAG: helix-turn-helix domain-containing protein [Gammaproteobacteria bacterium]|nr:helix-turn-helix domain-containing protein [Gammaproteobacteria bacterium]